jgi:hypothetical protein
MPQAFQGGQNAGWKFRRPALRASGKRDKIVGEFTLIVWEELMIVIRNVFRLRFGKAKEAVALVKEGVAIQKRAGASFSSRLLTDVTGPFYTLVLELSVPNLGAFEAEAPKFMGDKDWQANYQKLVPLVESGYREIFTVVD